MSKTKTKTEATDRMSPRLRRSLIGDLLVAGLLALAWPVAMVVLALS